MNSATLICPHCHHPIPLDEALNARATQVAEARLTEDRAKLESTLAKEFDQKLEQAVKSANEKARVEASKQQSLELRDLENRLKERDRQLDLARDQELQLRKKARELEEGKASWELTKAREIDQERAKIRQAEQQQLAESLKVKEDEYRRKEKELAAQNDIMQKTIEDLRRQVQQGSQQVQGEAQEKDIKSLLSAEFPTDEISDVPTGAAGADCAPPNPRLRMPPSRAAGTAGGRAAPSPDVVSERHSRFRWGPLQDLHTLLFPSRRL